jgi:hypothetical protein
MTDWMRISIQPGGAIQDPRPILSVKEIADIRATRMEFVDALDIDALCDSHEALRAELATTRAQRDTWDNRLHKLMDACGWDISFNLDRAIDAMVERLREANPDALRSAYVQGFMDGTGAGQRSSLGLTGDDRDQQQKNFREEAWRRAEHYRKTLAVSEPIRPDGKENV